MKRFSGEKVHSDHIKRANMISNKKKTKNIKMKRYYSISNSGFSSSEQPYSQNDESRDEDYCFQPPDFIFKLFCMVESESLSPVEWDESGENIRVYGSRAYLFKEKFGLKTNKLESIHRQLNNYGFQKISKNSEREFATFRHEKFIRGRKDLLKYVKKSIKTDEEGKPIKRRRKLKIQIQSQGSETSLKSEIYEMSEFFKNQISDLKKNIRNLQEIDCMKTQEIVNLRKKVTDLEETCTQKILSQDFEIEESCNYASFLSL